MVNLKKLEDEERALFERMTKLERKKKKLQKPMVTKMQALMIYWGSTLGGMPSLLSAGLSVSSRELAFSGRWDKKLQRDSGGRIFLDVNPVCFQAIVGYLNEVMVSSEDKQHVALSSEDENRHWP